MCQLECRVWHDIPIVSRDRLGDSKLGIVAEKAFYFEGGVLDESSGG